MRIFLLLLIFIPTWLAGITIDSVSINGYSVSLSSTILHYYYEYPYAGSVTKEILEADLSRFKARLERTGWYRNVEISNTVTNEKATITVNLLERLPYSVTIGNNYVGFGKFNLWGKGKTARFEVGIGRKRITLEDAMFEFTTFYYSVSVGSLENDIPVFTNTTFLTQTVTQDEIRAAIGKVIFPDIFMTLRWQNLWLKNKDTLASVGSFGKVGLKFDWDQRVGYPSVNDGFLWWLDGSVILPALVFQMESAFQCYFQWIPTIIFAEKLHLGFIGGEAPSYLQFNLRGIDGLRTLSYKDGLIGNTVWDIHSEVRWAFWDVIPFIIFDMQLEAVAFADLGEARANVMELGQPLFIYGAGIRVYVDNFAIRTEVGMDLHGAYSVISSFELPF